jgi:hypothetical protein
MRTVILICENECNTGHLDALMSAGRRPEDVILGCPRVGGIGPAMLQKVPLSCVNV